MNNSALYTTIVLALLVIGGIAFFVYTKDGKREDVIEQSEPVDKVVDSGSSVLQQGAENLPAGTSNLVDKAQDAIENKTEVEIELEPVDDKLFDQSGDATLTDENGKVKVVVSIDSLPTLNSPQPAHIHVGDCPGVGAVVYPLTNVVNGKSETVINTTLAELKKKMPLAINIHKSASESKVYTSCGEIK